jgi:hypothetical protein
MHVHVTEEAFSSQKGHPTLQNMNFKKILLLCVIFALLDPDPDFESGSTDPIESGSNPVSDPQPCLKRIILSSISYEK